MNRLRRWVSDEDVAASSSRRRPGNEEGPSEATGEKNFGVVGVERSANVVRDLDGGVPVDPAFPRSEVADEAHRQRRP